MVNVIMLCVIMVNVVMLSVILDLKLVGIFATVSHFIPSLIFAGKARAYPSGANYGSPI
jgi:hypothetical protein